MAKAYISEYSNLVPDESGRVVAVPAEPAITQVVTYTTTNPSAALNAATRFVRIVCDAKAHFKVALVPTADANDPYVAADSPEYFGVPKNSDYKVAFYDGSS